MKLVIFFSTVLLSFTLFADSSVIRSNIHSHFPITQDSKYLKALDKISEKSQTRSFKGLSMDYAKVNHSTKAIQYNYKRLDSTSAEQVCWLSLMFTQQGEDFRSIQSIGTELRCSSLLDD